MSAKRMKSPPPHRRDQSVVQREVDMVRTQLLWETNKLSEAESRLHISEQEQAKVKKELTKLRLRAQETSEKLQQGIYIYTPNASSI